MAAFCGVSVCYQRYWLDGLYYFEGVAMTITLTREEAQSVLHALESCSGVPHWPAFTPVIKTLRARLAQPEPREIKIEFKEWIHPNMGLVPVDPKTPLILKAVIREEV